MTFESILPPVHPAERSRLIAAISAFACVAAAGILARTMGSTVYLDRFGSGSLPLMYIGTAVLLTTVSYALGSLAARTSVSRMIVWTCGSLLVAVLIVRQLLGWPWGGFTVAAYFLSDLVSKLPMTLFWTFAGLVFNPREAKRLFGVIGAAGTLACVLAGLLVRPFADAFGTPNLLILVALLLAGFAASVLVYVRREPAGLGGAQKAEKASGRGPLDPTYYFALFRSGLVRNLGLLVVLSVVGLTFADFLFKSAARAEFHGPALAGFFGTFFAATNIVGLIIQLFLVHVILQRGGVLVGLLILPVSLLIAATGVALTGSFGWIVAAKFVDPVFDFTINSAALAMLYLGIKKQSRGQARSFVDGIAKPAAVAITGIVLYVAAGRLEAKALAAVVVGSALLWLVLCFQSYRAYVASLIDSLGARQFDLSQEAVNFRDKTFEAHLRQSLMTASDEEVPYLLGVLPEMGYTDWLGEHRALLSREAPAVKVAALDYLRDHPDKTDLPAVLFHLDHPVADVRAAAARAASALGGPRVTEVMEKLLADPAPNVRAAAAVELINIGDLDGLLSASVALKSMLGDSTSAARIAAGDALAYIRHGRLTRALSTLLADSHNDVRMAALGACRSRPDVELLPYIVPLLANHQIGAAAAETLVALGAPSIEAMMTVYEPDARRAASLGAYRVPAILAKIGDAAALPLLRRGARSPNLQLRREAVKAYCKLLKALTSLKEHEADIATMVDGEVADASRRRESLRRIGDAPGCEILTAALRDEYDWHLENAFALLALRAPGVDMKTIHAKVTGASPEARAEALEILDNVLDAATKQRLLQLLEFDSKRQTVDPADEVRQLAGGDDSEWVMAGALALIAHQSMRQHREEVVGLLGHASPVVRETALYALDRIAPQATLAAACQRLEHDPSPTVRDLARALASGTKRKAQSP